MPNVITGHDAGTAPAAKAAGVGMAVAGRSAGLLLAALIGLAPPVMARAQSNPQGPLPVMPASGPAPVAAPAPAPATPSAPVEPRFRIARYQIEGATLVPLPALQAAVAGFTGDGRRFSDIELAQEAIREAYGRAGITAVRVLLPEQTIESGLVRLQVEELRLGKLEVAGARHRSLANQRRAVPSLREGATPSDTLIGDELRLANENPGRYMQVTFRTEDDGALAGTLRTSDLPPVAGQVTLDNTGSPSTGQWRVGAAVQHHNLLDRDIVGTAQAITSPGREHNVQIASVGLRVPVYRLKWLLDGSLLHSNVDSGTLRTAAGDYFMSSGGNTLSLRATRLLPRLGAWDPRFSFGLDIKQVNSRVATVTDGPSLIPSVVLRPLSLSYSASRREDRWSVFGLASYSRNLPGSGRSDASVFQEPGLRAGANPYYGITRWSLGGSVSVRTNTLLASWSGQWTRDALVPAEQFAIGGDGSVRGFSSRVAAGDRGQRFSLEMQSPMRPVQTNPGTDFGWQVFSDTAAVQRNNALAGEKERYLLSSLGGGIRLAWRHGMSLRLDSGFVLQGDGLSTPGDVFLHMAMSYGF
jgi:hemolysin activation/secretion protein